MQEVKRFIIGGFGLYSIIFPISIFFVSIAESQIHNGISWSLFFGSVLENSVFLAAILWFIGVSIWAGITLMTHFNRSNNHNPNYPHALTVENHREYLHSRCPYEVAEEPVVVEYSQE